MVAEKGSRVGLPFFVDWRKKRDRSGISLPVIKGLAMVIAKVTLARVLGDVKLGAKRKGSRACETGSPAQFVACSLV